MQKQSKLKYDDAVFLKKVRQKEKPIEEFQDNAFIISLERRHYIYITSI
jgi:hypothetical protein